MKRANLMIKTVSRLMVASAAASMVFAPIAAQANTRAGDNAPVYTTNTTEAQPGRARDAEGESVGGGSSIILILLGAAAAIAGVVAVADSSDDGNGSPGT